MSGVLLVLVVWLVVVVVRVVLGKRGRWWCSRVLGVYAGRGLKVGSCSKEIPVAQRKLLMEATQLMLHKAHGVYAL